MISYLSLQEGHPAYDNFHDSFTGGKPLSATRFGAAVIAGLWSFDGWNNLNYVTAELKNPTRDLPRAIFLGIPGVLVVYIFANVAYLSILPVNKMVDYENDEPNEGTTPEKTGNPTRCR